MMQVEVGSPSHVGIQQTACEEWGSPEGGYMVRCDWARPSTSPSTCATTCATSGLDVAFRAQVGTGIWNRCALVRVGGPRKRSSQAWVAGPLPWGPLSRGPLGVEKGGGCSRITGGRAELGRNRSLDRTGAGGTRGQ